MPSSTFGSLLPPGPLPVMSCAAVPRPPLRCFLVEDNDLIRNNLTATLEEMLAARIVGTAGCEEGARQWLADSAHEADVLIIDLFLRDGSGLGVLSRAREQRPGARCIVLTNFATPDVRRRCEELGADRVFDKSSELDELLAYCATLTASNPRPD